MCGVGSRQKCVFSFFVVCRVMLQWLVELLEVKVLIIEMIWCCGCFSFDSCLMVVLSVCFELMLIISGVFELRYCFIILVLVMVSICCIFCDLLGFLVLFVFGIMWYIFSLQCFCRFCVSFRQDEIGCVICIFIRLVLVVQVIMCCVIWCEMLSCLVILFWVLLVMQYIYVVCVVRLSLDVLLDMFFLLVVLWLFMQVGVGCFCDVDVVNFFLGCYFMVS